MSPYAKPYITDWIDAAWVAVAGLVGLLALALVLWAFAGDRLRRRGLARRGEAYRRCPRCGYDMRSLANATCPECGRTHAERDLTRVRVRKRVLAMGALLILPAWAAYRVPEVRRDGWHRLMPNLLYVATAPMGETDWRARVLPVLDAGWCCRETGPAGRWLLARRSGGRLRAEYPDWAVETFIVTDPEFPDWEDLVERQKANPPNAVFNPPWDPYRPQIEYCARVGRILEGFVDREGWTPAVSRAGRIELLDRIVVGCNPDLMPRVRRFLAAIREPDKVEHLSEEDGILRIRCDALHAPSMPEPEWYASSVREERVRNIKGCLISCVQNERWLDNGGEEASAGSCSDELILVQGPPDLRARVADVVRALENANNGRATRLPAVEFGEGDAREREITWVWPMNDVLRAWGVPTPSELKFREIVRYEVFPGPGPIGLPGRFARDTLPLDGLKRGVQGVLRTSRFDPLAWTIPGGIDFHLVEDAFVCCARDPAFLDAMDDAIREAAKGPTEGEIRRYNLWTPDDWRLDSPVAGR